MDDELAVRLALALAIGLLVGLERGWRERHAPDRSRTAGIRTYAMSGFLGGLFAALSQALGSTAVFVAGLVAFTLVLSVYKLREAIADEDYSATGVIAGLGVFALGGLAVAGDFRVAAGGGAALAAVLASRELLHRLLRRMSWEELRAALILAVMTAIVLPLLPDRAIDPWQGFNPRQVWLFTILVAALSYAGYVATRVLGQGRGLLAGSVFGAIVSSTAVTVALARRSDEAPGPIAGAAALAAAVSISRVCVIVAIAAPAILFDVAIPALASAIVFVIGGAFLLFGRSEEISGEARIRNPFDLLPLLGFAASFAAIAAASAWLTQRLGEGGMLVTSALSAMFDVDVAVLSAARQLGTADVALRPSEAGVADAVLLALLSNAAGRTLLAILAGTARFLLAYAGIATLALGTGLLAYWV